MADTHAGLRSPHGMNIDPVFMALDEAREIVGEYDIDLGTRYYNSISTPNTTDTGSDGNGWLLLLPLFGVGCVV